MKQLFYYFVAVMILAAVGCESEYDKMSEYEKMVHDVGVSSKISAEDALKNVPLWSVSMIIYSSQPNGQGETSVYNHEIPLYGTYTHYFSFEDKMRLYSLYPTFGLSLTHSGIYIDYTYKLVRDNNMAVSCDTNVNPYRSDIQVDCCIDKARLVAYNEQNIVIEIYDSEKPKYPYATFLLKPSTKFSKETIERATANIDQFYIDNKHVFDEAAGRE